MEKEIAGVHWSWDDTRPTKAQFHLGLNQMLSNPQACQLPIKKVSSKECATVRSYFRRSALPLLVRVRCVHTLSFCLRTFIGQWKA